MASKVQITLARERLMKEMKALRDKGLPTASKDTFTHWGLQTLAQFKAKQLSERGPHSLGVITGFLRRSFTFKVQGKDLIEQQGIFGTYAKYAPIHEFGGIIRPVTKPLLRWYSKEYGWRSAKSVVMPARMKFRDTVGKEVIRLRELLGKAFQAKIRERGFRG